MPLPHRHITSRERPPATRKLIQIAFLAGLCANVLPVDAASVVAAFSQNGGFMSMQLALGFSGPGAGLVSPPPAFAPALVPGPAEVVLAPGTFTELPPFGDSKDLADITPKMTFSFGAPIGAGDDRLTFALDANLSAFDARNGLDPVPTSDPLNAEVHFKGAFEFFVDASSTAPPGTLVGELQFDPLGALDLYATLDVRILEFVTPTPTVLVSTSGVLGAPVSVAAAQLFSGAGYRIEYDYSAIVPYGIDPHYMTLDSLRFIPLHASLVPLPTGALLMAPALMCLAAVRRRIRGQV